jgi:ADP-heptose:LPS heptosyltransferase
VRRGESLPSGVVRKLGEEFPGEFFRTIVEALADSFDPAQAEAYERLMEPWIRNVRPAVRVSTIPRRVDTVFVLSRVTLGADIKITSTILDAMKNRFRHARIVFVGGRKSAELFCADTRIEYLQADYPRAGPVSGRVAFAHELRGKLETENRIVIDPDSRMTQLGLVPVCEPENYFHFPSRTAGGDSDANLSDLTKVWLQETFGVEGEAYVAPEIVAMEGERPIAAVSLGTGGNNAKRLHGEFEAKLIRTLGNHFRTIWVDRGAGGEEALRVSAAVAESGIAGRVHFWEGSFAGFVSLIAQSDFCAGYDSAGQHAAAAARIPLISIFAEACSERFRSRWAPAGPRPDTIAV